MKSYSRRSNGRWARQGTEQAEIAAARVRARTGLGMCARGDQLAAYVARRYTDGIPVAQIASDIRYSVDRMAELLAVAGRAPMARMILDQHHYERTYPQCLIR